MKHENENALSNQKGQTFIEFIFLLLILVSISFSFMSGMRAYVGNRWEVMLKIVAIPNSSEVQMP